MGSNPIRVIDSDSHVRKGITQEKRPFTIKENWSSNPRLSDTGKRITVAVEANSFLSYSVTANTDASGAFNLSSNLSRIDEKISLNPYPPNGV